MATNPADTDAFLQRFPSDPEAVESLIQLVEGDARALEELAEPVSLLGARAVRDALESGELLLPDSWIADEFDALPAELGDRLRAWAGFDVLDPRWLGDDATGALLQLARAGWVVKEPLRIAGPRRLWLRATNTADDWDRFVDRCDALARSVVGRYRASRTHVPEGSSELSVLRRALEHRPTLAIVDAWDRIAALQMYRDADAAAEHLHLLERWTASRDEPFAAVILARHRRRIGGLEDRVVADLQSVLPRLSGVEALEARLCLADCLGRIGSPGEAAEVAAEHATPETPEEEVAAVSLLAEAGSARMLGDDLDGAEAAFKAALPRARARGMTTEQAIIFGNLAMIATIKGDLERGHRCLDSAIENMSAASAGNHAMAQAVSAVLHYRAGDATAVHAVLASLGPVEETGLGARLIVELVAGRSGDEQAFGRALHLAEERGDDAQVALCAHFAKGTPLPSHLAHRPTLRLLGVVPTTPTLDVAPDGSWFETADGRVDLSRYAKAARVLAALAAADRPLTTPELVRAGWPGERIRPDAAANRLYYTLNQLRELGLRDWVVRRAGGYVLERCDLDQPR